MSIDKNFPQVAVIIMLLCSSCIMTKNPQYQPPETSYLDTRSNELVALNAKGRLSSSDVDEAYLLAAVYSEKKSWKEAKNLLKIVFDAQKTLSVGIEYMDTLNKLGEIKEADNVQKFLAVLYSDHEIKNSQKNIVNNF